MDLSTLELTESEKAEIIALTNEISELSENRAIPTNEPLNNGGAAVNSMSFRDAKILSEVVKGTPATTIATKLDINPKTVERCIRRNQSTLAECLGEIEAAMMARLAELATISIDTLINTQIGYYDPLIKVKAASTALSLIARLSELQVKANRGVA